MGPDGGTPIASGPIRAERALLRITDELDDTVRAFERQGPFRIRPIAPDPSQLDMVLWLAEPGTGKVVQAATVPVTDDP